MMLALANEECTTSSTELSFYDILSKAADFDQSKYCSVSSILVREITVDIRWAQAECEIKPSIYFVRSSVFCIANVTTIISTKVLEKKMAV